MRLSKGERRLGVREVRPAPGDSRDFPSDSYRPPTSRERARSIPVASGRERLAVGVEADEPAAVKRLADLIVDGAKKLDAARRKGDAR